MQVEIYSALSEIYDDFMRNIPYRGWADFIKERLVSAGIDKGLVLDLGCGSGTLTMLLSDMGYDMIGVDNSAGMLSLAMEKKGERDILYLDQDIRGFELYGTVRAVVAACDTLNYITEPEDLKKVFALVNNYLESDGLFIFDLHTGYYYEKVLADRVFAQTEDSGAYIWENSFDKESLLNTYNVTMFIKSHSEDSDLYERYEELHLEKCYRTEEIKALLSEEGLELVSVFDGYKDEEPEETSDRLVYIAGKKR